MLAAPPMLPDVICCGDERDKHGGCASQSVGAHTPRRRNGAAFNDYVDCVGGIQADADTEPML